LTFGRDIYPYIFILLVFLHSALFIYYVEYLFH
jgi:hypothetical protein